MAKRTADQRRIIERNKRRKERAAEQDLKLPKVKNPARKRRAEKDVFTWLKTYMADDFHNPFTEDQIFIANEILYRATHGGRKSIAAERGGGKTIIAEGVIIFCILTGKMKFPVIVCSNAERAEEILKYIKNHLERNDRLLEDYPEVCFPIRELRGAPQRAGSQTIGGKRTFMEWGAKQIILPTIPKSRASGAIFTTRGLDAAIRGLRIGNVRPDFILIDDPETRESVESKTQTESRKLIIEQDLGGLGSGYSKFAMVMLTTIMRRVTKEGTPTISFEYTDRKTKPAWDGTRLKLLITYPTRIDLWEEYLRTRKAAQEGGDKLGRKADDFLLANWDAMHEGAKVSNPLRYNTNLADDGRPMELSTLHKCWNIIADTDEEHFKTEYQNDPSEEDNPVQRLILTAHHIQHNCLSGLERRVVPEGTVLITRGADVQKRGLHWSVVAWNDEAAGAIIDYDFFSFGTDGQAAADCELAILEGLWAWHEASTAHPYISASGQEVPIDLTLVDMGWKDESWGSQPVQVFCAATGYGDYMPSKGSSPYRFPKPGKNIVIGDNWNCSYPNPFVLMNSDHWKLKVHEGFLCDRGTPGSLAIFSHPVIDGRSDRNFHLSFAKHILAESWETRLTPGFKRPETKWWHFGKPNHYFDSLYQAVAARSVRGLNVLANANVSEATKAQAAAAPEVQRANPRESTRSTPTRRRIDFRRQQR